MTTTDSTSTPLTTWSGVDVLYAVAGDDGPQVTLWTRAAPAADGDTLHRVADEHAQALAAQGWRHDTPVEGDDGRGGRVLRRAVTSDAGEPGLAAYWPGPQGVTTAVVTVPATSGPTGVDLGAVVDDLVAGSAPTFTLTPEEVLVLCAEAGLPAPPVTVTTFHDDAPDEVRTAALAACRGSLVARGLLTPSAAQPVRADLRAALDLLLDGEVSLLVSSHRPDGTTTALLGGRGPVLAELAPAQDGCLTLTTGAAVRHAERYAAWLGEGSSPADVEVDASLDRLRSSVGSTADEADPVSGALQLVSVRGLRRSEGETSALESVWLQARDGGLWSVTPRDDLASVRLTPADADHLARGLRDAFAFSSR